MDIHFRQVFVNDVEVNMPYVSNTTNIHQTAKTLLIKNHMNGNNITCDLEYMRCSLDVSGWYYGQIAGLLGTYDYEVASDYAMSDNSLTGDISVFGSSWSIRNQCGTGNQATYAKRVGGMCHVQILTLT